MKKILLVGFIALISGCATKPVPTEQATNAPLDRVWNKKIIKKSEGSGTVIVKRDAGFGGSACFTSVFVDGNPIADIGTREKVVFYPPVGSHILSAEPHGLCAGGLVEVGSEVKAGKVLIYRIGYGDNGDFRFSPTAF